MSVLHIPFQIVKVATGTKIIPSTPVIPWDKVEEESKKLDRFYKWDSQPPADPAPPKPKPKPKPDAPKPKPEPQPAPWSPDKDCQIKRGAVKGLKTQACIAENVAQAMTECYNRGFASAKRAYRSRWASVDVCKQAKDDAAWMSKRLKRIILQQDNPQKYKRTIKSRIK